MTTALILATGMTSALILAIASALVNLILGSIAGLIAWQNRRLVERNDTEHAEIRTDIKDLTGGQQEIRDRIAEVAEDRPRRDEVIGQYAALVQKVGDVAERVGELKGIVQTRWDRSDG